MPTINQLIRSPRSKQTKKNKSQHLKLAHRKEVFVQEFIQQPKKPNSALRKVARVKLI